MSSTSTTYTRSDLASLIETETDEDKRADMQRINEDMRRRAALLVQKL